MVVLKDNEAKGADEVGCISLLVLYKSTDSKCPPVTMFGGSFPEVLFTISVALLGVGLII